MSGKFPPYILKSAFPQVMAGLTECALVMAQTDQEFAESRREALRAIGSILSHGIIPVETVGLSVHKLHIETSKYFNVSLMIND
jgi:hypothetical protein